MAAADRGVRVRLLIDDYWASGQDPAFQAIDGHPNVEVRVFNPFSRARMRVTQLLGRFTELNRRMHNKLFVADGQVAVVGGRNLIDDYFGLGKEICYRDFDLLAIGPVAAEAEAGFDRYWNSQWTYPVSSLVKPVSQAERDRALAAFSKRVAADRATFPYALPHDQAAALAWLAQFRGKVVWGPAELVYDDPNSVANPANAPPGRVWNKMAYLANHAEHELQSWSDGGERVSSPPAGAVAVPYGGLPNGAKEVTIGGTEYLELAGIYYRQYIAGDDEVFVVAKP